MRSEVRRRVRERGRDRCLVVFGEARIIGFDDDGRAQGGVNEMKCSHGMQARYPM